MPRSREPFVWLLFSAGGMTAAMLLPAAVFVLWIAAPLGWISIASHADLVAAAGHALARLVLFGVVTLSLFHWAHRFRYTLYDGLQLYHLNHLIAVVTYGVATLLTLTAAYCLWVFG